jgi:hypothetical protein
MRGRRAALIRAEQAHSLAESACARHCRCLAAIARGLDVHDAAARAVRGAPDTGGAFCREYARKARVAHCTTL